MDIYIDAENLKSLFKQRNNPLFNDVIKTLKRQLNVNFNFSKENASKDELLSIILPIFNEGIDNETTFKYSDLIYPPRPIKSNLHTTHPDKHSLFLVRDDKVVNCQHKGGMMIYGEGEEIQLFEKLFLYKNDYDFDKQFGIGTDFKSWDNLLPFAYPLTDLVIVDNYIFSDNSLLVSNIHKLLKIIHSEKYLSTNIVFFTLKNGGNRMAPNLDTASLRSEIMSIVKSVTGINPSVTFVLWSQQNSIVKNEHDRTICSNYLRYYSGDSFNYFNSLDSIITGGSEFSIRSLAKRETFKLTQVLFTRLNNYVAKCNPDNITGDKVSNFIHFPT